MQKELLAMELLAAYLREHGFKVRFSPHHRPVALFKVARIHTDHYVAEMKQDGDTNIVIAINNQEESFDVHDPHSFPEVVAHLVKWNARISTLLALVDRLKKDGFNADCHRPHIAKLHNGSFWMDIELTDSIGLFRVGGALADLRGGRNVGYKKLVKYLKECDQEAKLFVAKTNERARKGIDG